MEKPIDKANKFMHELINDLHVYRANESGVAYESSEGEWIMGIDSVDGENCLMVGHDEVWKPLVELGMEEDKIKDYLVKKVRSYLRADITKFGH